MDLELVITTILTWMKVNVESAAPWVQWAGGAYAIYWFVRGNQVVLWDATKAIWWLTQATHLDRLACWAAKLTGVPATLSAANAWRKQPSRYTALLTRCKTLEDKVGKLPNVTLSYQIGKLDEDRQETADEIPVMPALITPDDRVLADWELEDRARVAKEQAAAAELCRQADLQAQLARARKPLDGGLNRRPAAQPRHIVVDRTTPSDMA